MKELVKYLAEALVEHPEEVRVSQVEGEKSIILELRVASSDMGKVIGKQGRVAKALRTVVKAAAPRGEKMVHLEIVG
ncbi:MAG TPA: KH domain-containing protein [Limnochordia bacterium]|jgi:Predicted RNA-binding protein (contains KH domain)|nr:KH domain-containing protein [Limnochordia bacterium]